MKHSFLVILIGWLGMGVIIPEVEKALLVHNKLESVTTIQPHPSQPFPVEPLKAYDGIEFISGGLGPLKKQIYFSNLLDKQQFQPEMVQIDPKLDGENIELNGKTLEISGQFCYRTTYTITLPPQMCDIYGQTLGESQTFLVTIRPEAAGFWFPTEVLLTLDPFGPPELPVFTVNIPAIAIQFYQVTPSDWYAYLALYEQHDRNELPVVPPGQLKRTHRIVPRNTPDRLVETRVDLSAVLAGKTGHILAVVQEPEFTDKPKFHFLWIQATYLAADITWNVTELRIWANELTTGKPVSQARVTMFPEGYTTQTDAEGVTNIRLSKKSVDRRGMILIEKGLDSVIVIEVQNLRFAPQNWACPDQDSLFPIWYIIGDRRIYRPGESVTTKGWVRHSGFSPNQQLKNIRQFAKRVKFRAIDSKGNELATGNVVLTKLGGFHCQFTLPKACPPGAGSILFELEAQVKKEDVFSVQTTHSFHVEALPPPVVEVFIDTPQPTPQVRGAQMKIQARVHSLTGLPCSGATITWDITAQRQPFSPPNWKGYQFGSVQYGSEEKVLNLNQTVTSPRSGQLDQSGQHQLLLNVTGIEPITAMLVTVRASIRDASSFLGNRQTQFLVHPAAQYIGMRSTWNFAEHGQGYPVELIVTDLEGVAQPGQKIELSLFRLNRFFFAQTFEIGELISQQTLSSAVHPILWTAPATDSGVYCLRALVWDNQGQMNKSEIVFLQLGECTAQNRFMKYLEPETIEATPNKPAYRPGEVAEITVQSPFAPAEGRLTVSNGRVLYSRRITLKSHSEVIKIPITKANVPTLSLVLDLVGTAPRHQSQPGHVFSRRPAFATRRIELDVEPVPQRLSVILKHQAKNGPAGNSAVVEVEICDAEGHPVNQAECALLVFDASHGTSENFPIPHPLEFLYQLWLSGSYFFHSRETVNIFSVDQPGSVPFGKNLLCQPYQNGNQALWNKMQRRPEIPESWNHFPPPFLPPREPPSELDLILAWPGPFVAQEVSFWSPPVEYLESKDSLVAFFPVLTTNQRGQTRVSLTVPETVTRYRVIAIAAAGNDQFGMSETSFSTR